MQHLPAGRVSSAGADAVEFAASCGLFLYDWQAWCLDYLLAEDERGEWVAQQAALIVPRQNGKNAVLEALELYAFYVLDEPRIIHTAHLGKTAGDHMLRMVSLVRANPELDAITYPYFANGKEALERTDTGARLEFITRGRRSVRGGSPRRIIFDEALFLTDDQMQAILPALSAQSMAEEGAPQMVYTASAPLAPPESEVLHRVRQRGIAGEAKRMFFAEWSCEPGVDPEDRDAWYASNPSMGLRISEEWIEENELSTMSPEAFQVERLGVVLEAPEGGAVAKLPADAWASCVTSEDISGPVTLAYSVTQDGAWASIALGAGDQTHPYVQELEKRKYDKKPIPMHQEGVGWLPAAIVALVKVVNPIRLACVGAGYASHQYGPIKFALAQAGLDIELEQLSMAEYRKACGAFYTDVVEGRLRWYQGSGHLDLAARDAAARAYGDSWSWDIRNATVPISPLEAATVARALLPTVAEAEPFFAFSS